MATNEELQIQVEVQCASLDSYHAIEEKWRKEKAEMEKEIASLKHINDSLIKLGDRLQEIIEAK